MLAMHAPSRALRGVRDPREEPARRQRSVGLAIRAEARQRPEGDARRGVQHRPQVSTRVLSPQRTAGLADPFARPGERPRPRLASFDEEEGRRDEVVKLPVRRAGPQRSFASCKSVGTNSLSSACGHPQPALGHVRSCTCTAHCSDSEIELECRCASPMGKYLVPCSSWCHCGGVGLPGRYSCAGFPK